MGFFQKENLIEPKGIQNHNFTHKSGQGFAENIKYNEFSIIHIVLILLKIY